MLRRNNLMSITAGLILSISGSVSLAEKGATGSGPNPYSDCGIGAALFPNSPVGATISNVIWDVGTTAVISATASPETCSGGNAQAAVFILETYARLSEETARGDGQHLDTLLDLMKVEESRRSVVISALRQSQANYLDDQSYDTKTQLEKSEAFYMGLVAAIAA